MTDAGIVLFADGTPEAVHAAVLRAWALAKPTVQQRGAEWTDVDGEIHQRRWRVSIAEDQEPVSVKQRRFLHGPVLGQIAERAVVNGQQFSAATWKEHFRRLFLGDRWVSMRLPGAKRATPQRQRVSSEDLTVKQYSEFIERILAYAVTELGIEFDLDQRERDEARYQPPKRRKQEPVAEAAST
jgi:hypothetical protein